MREMSVGEYRGDSIFCGPCVMYVIVGEPFVNTWELLIALYLLRLWCSILIFCLRFLMDLPCFVDV
jgi:hypothetical protein